MAEMTFEEVLRLAKQLSDEEKQALVDELNKSPEPQQRQEPSYDPVEAVKRVRRKAYVKARRYWESVGDTAKVALTDEELDEQFAFFDEEGIPRLKSEVTSLEPPVGSLAYAAKIASENPISSGRPDLARRSDEYLEQWLTEDAQQERGTYDEAENLD